MTSVWINIHGKRLNHLCFPDNVVLFASSTKLQTVLIDINRATTHTGPTISTRKSYLMSNRKRILLSNINLHIFTLASDTV